MKTLREQLIGAWKLASYVENPTGGSEPMYPMCAQPQGIPLDTPDRYMSAQLMKPRRPEFASGDWFEGRPERVEAEAKGYIAYSGPFHTDDEKCYLTHSMFVSLFPDWLGQTQPRVVGIAGGELRLSSASPIRSGGKETMSCPTWKRAAPDT